MRDDMGMVTAVVTWLYLRSKKDLSEYDHYVLRQCWRRIKAEGEAILAEDVDNPANENNPETVGRL